MRKFLLSVVALGLMGTLSAQNTLSSVPPLTGGNGSGGVTCNIQNNSAVPQRIDSFSYALQSTTQTVEIWYSTTPIAGPPNIAAPGWTLIGSNTLTGISAGLTPTLQPLGIPVNIIIPPGQTYAFYIGNATGSSVIYTNGSTAHSYTDGTMTIHTGSNIGYGGNRPNPTFHIRQFTGAIHYGVPISVPNDAGVTSIDTPGVFCAGQQDVWVTVNNFGNNQVDSVTVNWSHNGTLQTPVVLAQQLDTAGGSGPQSRQVLLGSLNITSVDTIVAWTTLPNNQADTVNGNDTTTWIGGPSLSGTYTLGGGAANYPTFAAAVNDLANLGVCGPVTFLVNPGTYNEQVSIPAISGASSTNTITFVGISNQTATLTYGATLSTANYTLQFDGADWVTFDSLVIESSGTTYGRAIDFSANSDWNTIENCLVRYNGTSSTTSTNRVLIYSASGTLNEYNSIADNVIEGGSYGMYWYGGGSTNLEKGNTIARNMFRGQYNYGARLYYQDSVNFNWNDIMYTNTYTGTSYGVYTQYADNLSSFKYNKVIGDTNQITNGGWRYGMYFANCDGTSANHVAVHNNMIANGDTVGTSTQYGIYMSNCGFFDVYHNSVALHNQGTNSRALYGTSGGGSSMANNILANFGAGYAVYLNSGFTFLNVDYNNLWAPNGNVGYMGGAQATFTNWQNASGFDANGYNVDPLFYSKTDLHTCADTLESAGTPLGLAMDIDMSARGTTPDIGADEFATLNGSFLGPDTAICPGDSVMIGVPGLQGTFAWSTGATTPTIYASTPQTYILTANSACGAGSDQIIVSHKPLPVSSFTQNVIFFTVQFTSTATNATSWWWDFGDGNTSTQQNPTHIYSFPGGTYNVKHVAYNACGNDTATVAVTANETTSINDNTFAEGIAIYPNPAKGAFNISMNLTQNQVADIEVVSVTGATVHRETVIGKQGTNVVNVTANFAKGAYFVRLKSEQSSVVKKLIIE